MGDLDPKVYLREPSLCSNSSGWVTIHDWWRELEKQLYDQEFQQHIWYDVNYHMILRMSIKWPQGTLLLLWKKKLKSAFKCMYEYPDTILQNTFDTAFILKCWRMLEEITVILSTLFSGVAFFFFLRRK